MVEWKKLGDICIPLKKEIIKQGDLKEGGKYPVTNSGITIYGYYDNYNNEGNAFTLASRGEYAGYISYLKDNFWAGGLCYPYRSRNESLCLTKFIYGYLKNKEQYIMDTLVMRGGIPALNKADVDKIVIPIPSLFEQTRIVGILDTFTSTIENLKEQIAERRKQYEYYRDQLLDLEGKEGVVMKTLGEVVSPNCALSYGIVQPGEDVADGVPVVRPVDLISTFVRLHGLKKTQRQISESYKRTILKGNEILFCVRGTTGIMGLATDELNGCNVTRGIVPISFESETTKMFVYHQLKSSRLQKKIEEKTNGTALRQINIKDLRLIPLSLPSLEEQSHIVSILYTFEASIANLEAQLKQREKQYDYYRNKLLTF